VPVRGDRQHADARAEPTVHEALAARLRIIIQGTFQGEVCLHALLPAQPLIMHIPSASLQGTSSNISALTRQSGMQCGGTHSLAWL